MRALASMRRPKVLAYVALKLRKRYQAPTSDAELAQFMTCKHLAQGASRYAERQAHLSAAEAQFVGGCRCVRHALTVCDGCGIIFFEMLSPEGDRHKPAMRTPWGEASRDILRAANKTQAAVAEQIGENVAYVNRLFSGQRRPSWENILRINRAIRDLTGHPRVERHLQCEAFLSRAMISGGLAGQVREEQLADDILKYAFETVLGRYQGMFCDGFLDRIFEFIFSHDDNRRGKILRTLVLHLTLAHRQILIAELAANTSAVGFALIRKVLERSGVDVSALLSERFDEQLALEQVQWVVRHELGRARNASPSERLAAESRIFEALHERFQLLYKPPAHAR